MFALSRPAHWYYKASISSYGLPSVSTAGRVSVKLTRDYAGIAGTNYWNVPGLIIVGGVGVTQANLLWYRASVPIVRAERYVSTALHGLESMTRAFAE